MAKPRKVPEGCTGVRHLSPEEIAELQSQYEPPLTREEILERREKRAAQPDKSHLTPWAPR